jgi:dihydropteroate synthase
MTPVIPPLDQLTVSGGESLVWGRRTYVMGIVNVSPDSFSGDGLGDDIPAIVDQALRMEAEGADFLDVGAESTRPGHAPITVDEELRRLIPALEALTPEVTVPISVDTFKSVVAREALAAGATLINDQWGLQADPEIASLAAETGAGLILMHNRHHRRYEQLTPDVIAELAQSANTAIRAGVPEGNIILDPGFGFGKTPEHNLEVLRRLNEFKQAGYPLLVGSSRKSTIGFVLDLPVEQRMEGTAATVALSVAGGADVVRVHDVREMVRVCRMSDAIVRGWRPANWKW